MEFKKIRLGQQESEYEYWKDKSHLERLNMVEKLRLQFIVKNEPSKKHVVKRIKLQ